MKSFDNIIDEAIKEAYQFKKWKFKNEAEFKHELFHILAKKISRNNKLEYKGKTGYTSILHAEARPENGINSKADIIICNPESENQPLFNYSVEYILELKYKFNKRNFEDEIKKLNRYSRNFKSIYFISATGSRKSIKDDKIEHYTSKNIIVKFPPNQIGKNIVNIKSVEFNWENIFNIVQKSILKVLNKYGNNKEQFKAYFWCNYEGEVSKGFSYPSEGDFNAFLYNELRLNLPSGIEIRSEFSIKDNKKNYRIDLVVSDVDKTFLIPIEVKMNWDQFKLETDQRKSEAYRILKRFELLKNKYRTRKVTPILVVIQGYWRIPTTIKKEESLYELRRAKINYNFMTFNEKNNQIEVYKHKID